MIVWCDGASRAVHELPPRRGLAPFETMGAVAGDLPLWDDHLARLRAAVAAFDLAWREPADLRAQARVRLHEDNQHEGVLRLLVLPSEHGVHTVLATRARSGPSQVRLLPTVLPRPNDAPPADRKAEPRTFHDAVRQQAQDGGADDGLIVAPDGAVLEASYGTLWVRLDGHWCTPPLDGRLLPGVGRARLFTAAAAAGVALHERHLDLGDLHRADALAHGNAVYGPRPACLLGGTPAVAIVDSSLGALWRRATSH